MWGDKHYNLDNGRTMPGAVVDMILTWVSPVTGVSPQSPGTIPQPAGWDHYVTVCHNAQHCLCHGMSWGIRSKHRHTDLLNYAMVTKHIV